MGISGNRECQWASGDVFHRVRFHRGCVDHLNRQFVPKRDSPNGEGELATARTTSLLVELAGVAA